MNDDEVLPLDQEITVQVKNKEILDLSLKKSKVRVREKYNSDSEVRKMKIYIDLNKEESEGYKTFKELVMPGDVKEQDFIKMIFLKGVEAINLQLTEAAHKYLDEHPEIMNLSGTPPVPSNVEIV